MKLHLNLTLRRAVLAAMAMLAVGSAQATVTSQGDDAYLTGSETWTTTEWNSIWNSYYGTLTVGNYQETGILTLNLSGTPAVGNSVFVGGKGYDATASKGNDGTLNMTGGNMTVTRLNVGNSQYAITGTLNMNGGIITTGEFIVGAQGGTGIVNISNGEIKKAEGSPELGFSIGHHEGYTGKYEDTVIVSGNGKISMNDGMLVVGASGNGTATLNVKDSAVVDVDHIRLGAGKGTTGTLKIDGGSVSTSWLELGSSGGEAEGTGELIISAAGRLTVTEGISGSGNTTIIVDGNAVNTASNDDKAVITFESTEASTMGKVEVIVDDSNKGALVGKDVTFISNSAVAAANIKLHGSYTWGDNTYENVQWATDDKKGTYIAYTNKDNTATHLYYTASGPEDTDTISRLEFTGIQANIEKLANTNTIIYDQIATGEAETSAKQVDDGGIEQPSAPDTPGTGAPSNPITKDDTIVTATLTDTTDSNNKLSNVVVATNTIIETGNTGSMTVQATVTTAETTTKDELNQDITTQQVAGSSGLTLVLSGSLNIKNSSENSPESKNASLGFEEGSAGSVTTTDSNTQTKVKNEVKMVDVVKMEEGAEVSLSDVNVHSTHALTVAGTEEKRASLTLNGGTMSIGGTKDSGLSYEVTIEVPKTGEDGKIETVKITEVRETQHHVETNSTIKNADITLSEGAALVFKTIDDAFGHHHGTTEISNSTVKLDAGTKIGLSGEAAQVIVLKDTTMKVDGAGEVINVQFEGGTTLENVGGSVTEALFNSGAAVSMSNKDGENAATAKITNSTFDNGATLTNDGAIVEDTKFKNNSKLHSNNGTVNNVVISNGSHLSGKGNLKKVHVDKDSYLTVGSSPGKFSAEDLTVDGVTNFYIITDSNEWKNYTGNSDQLTATEHQDGAAKGNWGAISQLEVKGNVTLNGLVTFTYQHFDDATGEFVTEDTATARESMKEYFQEGSSIKFISFDGGSLTLGSGFSVDEASLPELEEGLFWDLNSLFTESTVYVISEILEEPVRVANSMVSAGETVLNFGRVAEAQAILRKAGTTRVWGSALGSFDSVDSDGARTGYDYNSWGGTVGVDHAFTSRTVLGVAFGCSWGENEAEKDNGYYSAGSIDQDATMIGLYGTHKFRTKGLMNDMKLSAFAAYGQFENSSSRTGLKSGHNATAEWDSDAWVLSASLSRDITTDSGLVVTPYVGVEYTKAGMDDFTEKGKGYNATYTADEDYSNLAVKVGVSVSKTIGSFTPYAGIAYINDVARDTPKVTASGKRTITGEASMPGRSAVQLNLGTGVKLSDSWDAYAGYTAELRSKATEHNVNVGVGYTF